MCGRFDSLQALLAGAYDIFTESCAQFAAFVIWFAFRKKSGTVDHSPATSCSW